MPGDQQLVSIRDIKRVWSVVRKNWIFLALFPILAFFAGEIYIYRNTPVYSASMQLQVRINESYNPGSVISDNAAGGYGNVMRSYVDISNEKRVISSYNLIEKAIDKLNFDISYFIVGRLRTEEMFQGIPFRVDVITLNNRLYEQKIRFEIKDSINYVMTYKVGEDDKTVKGKFGDELIESEMRLKITKTRKFGSLDTKNYSASNYLVQIHDKANLIRRYQRSLTINNPEYTNILQINVADVISKRGIIFLDTLASTYIENTKIQREDINSSTLLFIDKQMDEVTGFLNSIEDTMQNYREQNTIYDLGKEGDLYFGQMVEFDTRKRLYQLQFESLNDLESYIIEDKDPDFLPPSAYVLNDDPFLQKSVDKLYNLQIELKQMRTTSTESNFNIKLQLEQVGALKKSLLIYLGNSRKAITENIREIDKQIGKYSSSIQELPYKQRGLTNILRKQKVNEELYLFLLQKRANTIIAKASIVSDARIIESAQSAGLMSPKREKTMLLFVGVGLLLAIIFALIRTFFFEKINSAAELKERTDITILGEVGLYTSAKDLEIVVEHDPKSWLAESFRSIRTNLQYLNSDNKPSQIIVVSSTNPGEGKTFCSVNLASMLARSERKVIILELDLHKPRVHKALKMDQEIGVSTIMLGKHTIAEAILPSSVSGLDTLLSGPLPPNPSELLVTKKMTEILEYCRQHYEFIIIDTPPIGIISDAQVLMKEADVSLFVMNCNLPYRAGLSVAKEFSGNDQIKNFCIIVNGVKRRKGRYYTRYGYRYRYGYGNYGSYGDYVGYGDTPDPKNK
jgi:capsular exopolysaccharide synthesis family protein